jgi:thioredoxin
MSRSPHITDLTEQSDLDARIAAGPVLVDLWAPWCGPCRTIGPLVDALADEYAGRISVVAVNVDDAPSVAERYGVRSIPTLIYFPGDATAPRRMTGLADAARLRTVLELPT